MYTGGLSLVHAKAHGRRTKPKFLKKYIPIHCLAYLNNAIRFKQKRKSSSGDFLSFQINGPQIEYSVGVSLIVEKSDSIQTLG
jgi:hypothetical protein